jgi:Protein of unknown function (DUF2568)
VRALGWAVLALVFVDELLALAALAVWGYHASGIAVAVAAPAAWAAAWFLFAAPGARHGSRIVRPAVKVIALGLACLALRAAGYTVLAIALLVFSAGINGLAQLPAIRALPTSGGKGRHDDADPAGHRVGGRRLSVGSAIPELAWTAY